MSDPQPIPDPVRSTAPPHADPDPSGPVPGRLDRDGATAPPEPPAARFRAGSTATARPRSRTTPGHCPLRAA